MKIREASPEDFPVIARIAEAAFRKAFAGLIPPEQVEFDLRRAYTLDALREQGSRDGHRFDVALDGDRVVGFASASASGERWRLHKLYVDPALQGRGAGAALLEAVVEEARRRGLAAVELFVNRGNPAADFYGRRGFRIEREADLEIGPGFWRRDYVMARSC